jgi:hypothetical protein
MENFSSKKIALKGNNNEATLKISEKFSTSVEYKATFPDVDTYYVYIDDVKQDANIIPKKNFESQTKRNIHACQRKSNRNLKRIAKDCNRFLNVSK